MKASHIFFTLSFLLVSSFSSFAQEAKMKSKSQDKVSQSVAELNTTLTTADAKLALTDDQKESITKLYTRRDDEIKAVKAKGLDEAAQTEAIKAVRKVINEELGTILSKEQKAAKRAANKQN